MSPTDKIRQEIFSKIQEFNDLRKKNEKRFVPGTSPVPYAGRVFDEQEMVALVDASLDFWLTTGRYA